MPGHPQHSAVRTPCLSLSPDKRVLSQSNQKLIVFIVCCVQGVAMHWACVRVLFGCVHTPGVSYVACSPALAHTFVCIHSSVRSLLQSILRYLESRQLAFGLRAVRMLLLMLLKAYFWFQIVRKNVNAAS